MADTLDLRHRIKRCPECHEQFSPESTFCPFDGHRLEAATWDPAQDPLGGAVVGERYEVLNALGEGGMGTVYDVRHLTLGRHFAMKVLRRDLAKDAALAARFVEEAKATASIHHPHVVAISDFGELDDGRPYFVMELLAGKTLADLIREAPPPPRTIVRIVSRLARALGAAHAAGVIHRDLKPDNVFVLDPAGNDVRIVDFGAALVMGKKRVTKTGVVFGTPHYMSPEQAGGQPIDQRADVYALGVILYVLLSGGLPFEADTFMGVITKHMFVRPETPRARREARLAPLVPEDEVVFSALEVVCLRALEKNPDQRYLGMSALADDLERAATPEGAQALLREARARAPSVPDLPPSATRDAKATPASLAPWVLTGVALVVAAMGIRAAACRSPAGEPAPASASIAATKNDPPARESSSSAPSAPPPESALPVVVVDPPDAAKPPRDAPPASVLRPPPLRGPRLRPARGSGDFVDPWAK